MFTPSDTAVARINSRDHAEVVKLTSVRTILETEIARMQAHVRKHHRKNNNKSSNTGKNKSGGNAAGRMRSKVWDGRVSRKGGGWTESSVADVEGSL